MKILKVGRNPESKVPWVKVKTFWGVSTYAKVWPDDSNGKWVDVVTCEPLYGDDARLANILESAVQCDKAGFEFEDDTEPNFVMTKEETLSESRKQFASSALCGFVCFAVFASTLVIVGAAVFEAVYLCRP